MELLGQSISFLGWSILCVNLAGMREAQMAGETWLLGVSVRLFPEEISTGICKGGPHQGGWASSNPLRV